MVMSGVTASRFLPFSSDFHHPSVNVCGSPPPGTAEPVMRMDTSFRAQREPMHSPRAQSAFSSHGSSRSEGSRHSSSTHTALPVHSSLLPHSVRQAVSPHGYGAHADDSASPQLPRPSHVRAPYSTPPKQSASAQTVPAA